MRRTFSMLVAALATSCAATGLSAPAEVTPTTLPPVATLAPTTTMVVPTTTTVAPTTTQPALTTTAAPPGPLATTLTVDALTITIPADWVAADLLNASPTEAALVVRPLDNQRLIEQMTILAEAGGILWAERADGTGAVTANILQSAPRAEPPVLLSEADDIQRQLEASGTTLDGFRAEEVTVGDNQSVRVDFGVIGLGGRVDQTQYLFADGSRVYVLTFATQNPEFDRPLFASIAETVSFG